MIPLPHSLRRNISRRFARSAGRWVVPLLLVDAAVSMAASPQPGAPPQEAPTLAPAPAPGGHAGANATYQHALELAKAAQASGGSMDEAIKELTQAANLGQPFAITTLARMYRLGEAVPKDEARADALIARVDRATDPVILFQAGLSYLPKDYNQPPVEKNVDKAQGFLLRSAQQGYGPALGPLGFSFMAASPERQDLIAAFQWLYLAATQGDESARMYLERLRPRLTNAQTAEAMQRLNALRSRSQAGRAGTVPPGEAPAAAAPQPGAVR